MVALAVIGAGAAVLLYPRFEAAYQAGADVYRLRHLKYYGELIEEYRELTGRYPFEGEAEVPLYAFVAHDRQVDYTEGQIPYAHERRSMAELVAEIETGLGRTIDEYYDPQYVPTVRPNFYMYLIDGDRYFFAVHLQERFSFSQPVADRYNKIEISNRVTDADFAVLPEELFTSEEFNAALTRQVRRRGSLDAREAEYLHFTKQVSPGG